MIKGVFFDVGGTLFSYRNLLPATQELMRALAQRLNLAHSEQELLAHYQGANQSANQTYAEQPTYLYRHYFEAIFLHFLDRVDRGQQQADVDWFEPLQREMMLDALLLQEDCAATLSRLQGMDLYLSAVSNADNNQLEPLIERGQLQRWLVHWTSSESAQSCKPDQGIFRLALERSGLQAQEVVFVGDSPEQDIAGAHRAGMKTVLISELDAIAPMSLGKAVPEPDFRIKTLSELPAIIEKLRQAQ